MNRLGLSYSEVTSLMTKYYIAHHKDVSAKFFLVLVEQNKIEGILLDQEQVEDVLLNQQRKPNAGELKVSIFALGPKGSNITNDMICNLESCSDDILNSLRIHVRGPLISTGKLNLVQNTKMVEEPKAKPTLPKLPEPKKAIKRNYDQYENEQQAWNPQNKTQPFGPRLKEMKKETVQKEQAKSVVHEGEFYFDGPVLTQTSHNTNEQINSKHSIAGNESNLKQTVKRKIVEKTKDRDGFVVTTERWIEEEVPSAPTAEKPSKTLHQAQLPVEKSVPAKSKAGGDQKFLTNFFKKK
eukprot:TRINITY_DN3364_c0_g2_i8.p1 TRINITY_DN3364_c0_g2~~TRINITY_DN3364_c0_g2_i8.p1  ORF type:complete len:296 (-),score=60.24 TRINITY_DN3364_c0_g2_i8:145-1032(-)